MIISLNKICFDLSKFEPLNENNFKHCSQKHLIFFVKLEVAPTNGSSTTTDSNRVVVVDEVAKKKFKKDNANGSRNLLNHMANSLFNLFVTYKSAKEMWNSLKKSKH